MLETRGSEPPREIAPVILSAQQYPPHLVPDSNDASPYHTFLTFITPQVRLAVCAMLKTRGGKPPHLLPQFFIPFN